ncbi:hypothetical protein [Nostoc sp. PCC 9305]
MGIRYWALGIRYWALGIGHWALDIGQAERSPNHQELKLLQQRQILP